MLCLRDTITKHKTCECVNNKIVITPISRSTAGTQRFLKRRKNTEKAKSRLFLNHRDIVLQSHRNAAQPQTRKKRHRHQACFWFFTKLLSGVPPTQCEYQATFTILTKILRAVVGMMIIMGGKRMATENTHR